MKTVIIRIQVPDWLDEEEVRKAVEKAISRLACPPALSAKEVEELFGRFEGEVPNDVAEKLRAKERERLRW